MSPAVAGMCVVVLFGVVKLALPLGRTFTSGGDVAFIELGVRQALHGGTALGPYSRFGWHHPGPALFYLDAPLYWLTGQSSRSLFLDSWLLNSLTALGAVITVRMRGGELAAQVAGGVLLVYLGAAGFRAFTDPWNPAVLALPLLLLMVSVAAAVDGSLWSTVVALVSASYLVQTHIGTVPVCSVLVLVGAAGLALNLRRERRAGLAPPTTRQLWVPVSVGVALLSAMWVGPIAQQLTNSPGNLAKIVRFYVHPRGAGATSHSLGQSLTTISNHATIVPFGNVTDQHAHVERVLLTAAFAILGLAVAYVARRRSRFLAALALLTPIGLVVATLSISRVVGPLLTYLFSWTHTIPLAALIAMIWLGLECLQRRADRSEADIASTLARVGVVASRLAMILIFVVAMRVIARGGTTTFGDSPDARAVATDLEHAVGSKQRPFTLEIAGLAFPRGALIAQLDKDGYLFRLDPPIQLFPGSDPSTTSGPVFAVQSTIGSEPAGSVRQVARVGQIGVWLDTELR